MCGRTLPEQPELPEQRVLEKWKFEVQMRVAPEEEQAHRARTRRRVQREKKSKFR